MTSNRLRLSLLAIAAVACGSLSLVAPSEASALDLQIAPEVRGGVGLIDDGDDNDDNDPPLGYGFGLQLPVLFKVHPMFSVGPMFDFSMHFHSESENNVDSSTTTTLSVPGLMLRSDISPMFAIELWGGYAFGSFSFEAESGGQTVLEGDIDVSGFQIGIEALYRIKMDPYKTWIEVGPYFNYNSLSPDIEGVEDPESQSYMQIGLAVQGTFEVGL